MSTGTLFWNQSISDFGAGWSNGKVETISMKGRNGCFNDDRKDLITGLPVSNSQSAPTSLEFWPSVGMALRRDGDLYVTDKGEGEGVASTDCVGGSRPVAESPDFLHRIVPGKCHGFPNINRGECIFHDSRCVQTLLDNIEPAGYGLLEYRSNTFQGKLKDNLFLSKFPGIGDGKLSRVEIRYHVEPSVQQNGFTSDFFPKSGGAITEGPGGELVLPRLQQGEVLVLRRVYEKPVNTTVISVLPRRGPAAGGITVLITGHNFGATPKADFGGKPCTDVKSIDADSFTCVTPDLGTRHHVTAVVSGSGGCFKGYGMDYRTF